MAFEINGVEIRQPLNAAGGVPVLDTNGRTAFWTVLSAGFAFPGGTVPTGTIDGTNTSFTLPSTPGSPFFLFLNGLLMIKGTNYTLDGTTITFSSPVPQVGDTLIAF